MTGGKVLVLGDDTRSFLATVRSLGRRGVAVHAAPANFRSPALRSRYIAAIHDLPPWLEDGAEWLSATEALLAAARFDLVIPCDETTLLPLRRHRERLMPLARLAIPDDRTIAVLFDKHATRKLARRAGVPVAAGRLLRPDDTAETILAELGAPVVVKPRRSYSLQLLAARGKVQVVRDPAALQRLVSQCDPEETLLEQFFAGQGMGVSLLASRGRVLQAFEHHRVREISGASFYRVSAPLTPELIAACEAIVAAVHYTGLAMFEFKRNEGGDWILLEINARPWGSMPLPIALGVDFPYRWYRLLTADEELPGVAYRAGIYGRNLIPDLRASMAEAEARRLGPIAKAGFAVGRAVELLRPLAGREVHDLLVHDDPRPAFYEVLEIVETVRKRGGRLLPAAAARQRRRARSMAAHSLQGRAGKPLVLFVCQGNICRSPFAAALLRARLGDGAIEVGSAGMMPQSGRSPPDLGIEAAAAYGVDLSRHRSAWLMRETAEAASLLVVFDDINRAALFDRYPNLGVPVISLGELTGLGSIADPVDGDLAEFCSAYERIAAAIAELAALLPRSRSRVAAVAAVADTTLSSVRDLAAVESAWRALEAEAVPSFFQSWTWVGCLAAQRFPHPVLLRAERGGRTVGLALLNRRHGPFGGERLWLNESGDPALDRVYVEHNGVLLARDAGDLLPACLRAMLTAPVEPAGGFRGWGRQLRLAGVDAAHLAAAKEAGAVFLLQENVAPFVDLAALPAAPDAYLASLSANTRYQIRRSNRCFARLGPLAVRQAETLTEALGFLNALAALHQATWTARGVPGAFADPIFLRFHRALVARALPRREVALLQIAAGSHVLGYLYNFRLRDRVLTYQSGFDYAAAAAVVGPHAKPGLTCHHVAILRARTEGAVSYDFLAGPDRYKTSLANRATPLYWLDGAPSRSAASLRLQLRSLAHEGQAAP